MRIALAALGERNFRLLFSARTISFFGTNLAPIAVAFGIPGVVADRLPRRSVSSA